MTALLAAPHLARARAYLALAGGIESERFMGSASTDVRGLIGRPLAAGDVLGTAREVESTMRMSARVDWPVNGATVRIMPGPKATSEALGILDGADLRTAARDRTGVRLEGVEIPGGEAISEPPPLGARPDHAQRRAVRAARRPLTRQSGGQGAASAVKHPDDLGFDHFPPQFFRMRGSARSSSSTR